VVGIGGVFLRARRPAALCVWYAEHLGIELTEWGGSVFVAEEGDATVWSIFPDDTHYFGRPEQRAMVNYRVRDLDAMLQQLRGAGADVDDEVQDEDNGRFGWVTDPEGNRIELWEPRASGQA
jgi:predicted enzyme related to lactoylglutathione lyase